MKCWTVAPVMESNHGEDLPGARTGMRLWRFMLKCKKRAAS